MEPPGKKRRGRPARRYVDEIKEEYGENRIEEKNGRRSGNIEKNDPPWRPQIGTMLKDDDDDEQLSSNLSWV